LHKVKSNEGRYISNVSLLVNKRKGMHVWRNTIQLIKEI
jgi:hypothetical protein